MSLKDFQILAKLGEGAYSSVYKVKRLNDGCEYALKKVKLLNLSEKEKQNALNEVRILASIRHTNIVGYKEAFLEESSNSLCIIMEFANNGDLYQKIIEHQKKGSLMQEVEIWSIFVQMVKGLKALHDLKIFHRDLKVITNSRLKLIISQSANVFLNKDGTVKLGDLNVSKIAKQGLLYTQTGTPYYASPEVWRDQPYDQKSDVWSMGCVLYEMTTLKPPFRAEDMEGLYKKVLRGYYPKIPSHYSQDLNNTIRILLQVSPHLRPNCDKILQLSAITKRLDDKTLTEYDEVAQPNFLNTIRIPKNLHYLTERLPKPNYAQLRTKKIEKNKFLQTLAGYKETSNLNDSLYGNNLLNESESVDSYVKDKTYREINKENRIGGHHLPSIGHSNNNNNQINSQKEKDDNNNMSDNYKLIVLREYKEKEKERIEKERIKQQLKHQQSVNKVNIGLDQLLDNGSVNDSIDLAYNKKYIKRKKDGIILPSYGNVNAYENGKEINIEAKLKGNNIEKIYGIKANKKIEKLINNEKVYYKMNQESYKIQKIVHEGIRMLSEESVNEQDSQLFPNISVKNKLPPLNNKINNEIIPITANKNKLKDLSKAYNISLLDENGYQPKIKKTKESNTNNNSHNHDRSNSKIASDNDTKSPPANDQIIISKDYDSAIDDKE